MHTQGIFISYRRDDSKAWAAMLRQELAACFGTAHVYLDVDTQRAGNWREQILRGLGRSKVVLVIIGPRWLTIAAKDGTPLLDNPDDMHRQEIALALSTPGVVVIPIRIDGATMPGAHELALDIRALADQQWRDIAYTSAHREVDIRMLVEDIEKATGLRARKSSGSMPRWRLHGKLLGLSGSLYLFTLTFGQLALLWEPMSARENLLLFLLVLFLVYFCVWVIEWFKRR